MAIINIKTSTKLSDVEHFYFDLKQHVSKKEQINVSLPKELNKSFFSVSSSLIQFIATWLRSGYANVLIIDINANEDSLERFYEQEFTFPILALAWNDVSIENTSGQNVRHLLRNYQNKFILKMRSVEAMKGDKLLLVNLDHFEKSFGLLPLFENSLGFTINENDLNERLKFPILNDVLKYSKITKNDFKPLYNDVVSIIYELMKNTYEWGKNDEFMKPMSPSARGLYIRFYKRTRSVVLNEYKLETPIISFFNKSDIVKGNLLDQVYFIEISVFDTGVGFVRKFNTSDKKNFSDVEIIKKCLIKNQTSATGIQKKEKGIGLDRMLNILNNKGFLRIRTDKYCLYRNLITHPYKEVEKGKFDQMELFDWNTNSQTTFSKLEYCSGSNISILYPLPQYEEQ